MSATKTYVRRMTSRAIPGLARNYDVARMTVYATILEMAAQDRKFTSWQAILGEEVGESAREASVAGKLHELVQVAAVALSHAQALAESLGNREIFDLLTDIETEIARPPKNILLAEAERRGFPDAWWEGGYSDDEIEAW